MRVSRYASAAVALCLTVPALAQDFRPRVVLSWETRDVNGMATSQLRQDIDVFLSRAITDTIALDMVVGANHYNQSTDTDLGTSSLKGFELRPSGALHADFGPVRTQTTFAMRRSRAEVDGTRSEKVNEQFDTGGSWDQGRYAPGGTFRALRYRLDDRIADRQFLNDFAGASLFYGWRGLSIGAGRGFRVESDNQPGYERRTTDTTAGLTYTNSFAGGRLTVAAASNATQSIVDDQSSTGSRVPTYIAGRVLWAVDDTPLDSGDHPLAPYPALNDGRTEVLTEIDLGPNGASFQAFAFDFSRVSPVDEIDVIVRDERQEEVDNATGVRFDVYTSLDGIRWTPHLAGVTTTFDSVRSLYEVVFESVDTQWIKVVSFGAAPQPVLVTETQALFHRVVGASENDTEYRTLVSNAAVYFTPVRSVTLGYTGNSYQTEQKSGESLQSDIDDVMHIVSGRYEPRGWFSYEARYELHDVVTDREEQHGTSIVGSVRFSPRPQLTTTLQCDRREEELQILSITGRTCSANLTARIYSTFDVTAGVSNRSEESNTGGTHEARSLWISSDARVTRSLRVMLAAALNRGSYDRWEGPLAPLTRDDRYTAEVEWIGGRALGLGATASWVETPSFSGLLQRYRIRWSPFGDGSVSLITNYTQDVDPYTDSRSDRILVSPRWQINPRAALTLTYTAVSNSGQQSYASDSLLASLILGR